MNDSVYADCRMGKNVNTTNKTCKETLSAKSPMITILIDLIWPFLANKCALWGSTWNRSGNGSELHYDKDTHVDCF